MKVSIQNDADGKDEEFDIRFRDDPEAIYRIYSIISYFIVLVIIGIPIWWHTTRVYRANLPLDEMINIEVPVKTTRENSIPLSLEYDVLISVINPSPKTLKLDVDIYSLTTNLKIYLDNVQLPANITFKSQWLYLVDLGVVPKKQGEYLILQEDQLPHIITPLEKEIMSHMSPRPSLNLVLFVTECGTPIYIHSNNKPILNNAILSPRWGGVTILNADMWSCGKGIYQPDLIPIINIFYEQLRDLLGLKGDSKEQVMELKLVKTHEMIDSTKRTLKSLAQLLSEINSIVISDEIGSKIEVALENVRLAGKLLHQNKVDDALRTAQKAFKYSEEAFSDPSLLALLYFPDDQKYAVYIPLFLPIMIPVLMSLTTARRLYAKLNKKVKSE